MVRTKPHTMVYCNNYLIIHYSRINFCRRIIFNQLHNVMKRDEGKYKMSRLLSK